jgi:uncharacterized glyoxalase superfamily protein PhnB
MNIFYATIIFVTDLIKSRNFYRDIIGLNIQKEYDTIVYFENRFTMHAAENLLSNIFDEKKEQLHNFQGQNNLLIYFETDRLEKVFDEIVKSGCEIIHPIRKQAWGQKNFRFFDPDRHIIEIGEALHLKFLSDNSYIQEKNY